MWRHRSRILKIARWAITVQLGVGTAVVLLAQRPPIEQMVAVQEQAFSDRAAMLEARLKKLEDLDIGSRVAVLEKIATDGHDTKLLVIGAIVALCGNLLLGVIDRKMLRKGDR